VYAGDHLGQVMVILHCESFTQNHCLGPCDAGQELHSPLHNIQLPLQVKLVQECIAMENLGQAWKSTRFFGLQREFPTVERDFQEHVLARLIGRQQWQAALTACDDDAALQVRTSSIHDSPPFPVQS